MLRALLLAAVAGFVLGPALAQREDEEQLRRPKITDQKAPAGQKDQQDQQPPVDQREKKDQNFPVDQKNADQKNADQKNAADKDRDQNKDQSRATIVDVDRDKGSITVRMKDAQGKDVERTFRLTGNIRYFDSAGNVAAVKIFRSGDQVLIIEREGNLHELRHSRDQKRFDADKQDKPGAAPGDERKDEKPNDR